VEENEIKTEFGLKNKKELWKSEARVKSIKERAKKLISADEKNQKALFDKLKKIGINVNSIADVLSLDRRDYLKRRLQSILVNKKKSSTVKGARQLITHKKVLVNGNVVNSPSYIVPIELEGKIMLKTSNKKPAQEIKKELEVAAK
jgi:small subunit ribosomal protein S4